MWCGEEYGVEERRVNIYYSTVTSPPAQLPFHDPVTRIASRIFSLLQSPGQWCYWGCTGEKGGSPLWKVANVRFPAEKAFMSISLGTRR